MSAHQAPRRRDRRRLRRRRRYLAFATVGLLATLGIGGTAAAYSDSAILGLGAAGLGAEAFDIAVLTSNGLVSQADPSEGVAIALDGENTLAPGRTVSTTVAAVNNSPTLNAAVEVFVEPLGSGQVDASPNITPYLRVTVYVPATGELILGGSVSDPTQGVRPGQTGATGGTLEKRGLPQQQVGEAWIPGAFGDDRMDLAVVVHYLDRPGTELLNGGRSALVMRLVGTSTN